jgi:hypothetical protein
MSDPAAASPLPLGTRLILEAVANAAGAAVHTPPAVGPAESGSLPGVVASLAATPPKDTQAALVAAGVIAPKAWWESTGINGSLVTLVGALVTVGAAVAHAFGWAVDVGAMTEAILGLIGLIGGGMSWWGRVHSAQPISRVAVLPGVTLQQPAP